MKSRGGMKAEGFEARRRALSALLAAASAALLGAASGNGPPKVNEKDSLAVALGYVSDASHVDRKANPTYQPGATCSGCSWYQGKPGDPDGGPCTFFPDKRVDAHGWCRMWSKKQ